jgi:outer membrane protein
VRSGGHVRARRATLAISCARSEGGRYRSGDLIQCGPALMEDKSESIHEILSWNQVPRSSIDPMKSKFLRLVLAFAAIFAISALAQTSSAATPSDPAARSAPKPETTGPAASAGTKVGIINIQEAIFGSNEGQRDMEALQKKFEPKQNELKSQNDELEALKKQLNTQQSTLNDDALASLKSQIESKQKTFDRSVQDAQEDFGNQRQEIATRILKKMAPMIVKYSQDNGFKLVVDSSKPWPDSPVLWWDPASVDITKPIVDAYNVQSGVAAPAAAGAAAKPAASRPTTSAPRPAAPKTSQSPK